MLKKYFNKNIIEAGCDEAGRGCLAGDVFAAAVILPKNFKNKLLNDSKKLSEKQRNQLRPIIEQEALAWAVGRVTAEEIDTINILNAAFLAMHRAIDKLSITPGCLLIDGNRFKQYHDIPHKCIIKGDGKYMSIAAASILAKTHRDEYMEHLHKLHPQYDWIHNKAYGTVKHREAIAEYGITEHHRKSFQLLAEQLSLEL